MAQGGAIAGMTVQQAVTDARAQMAAWAQVLRDPAVQQGIRDIANVVGEVAGVAYTAQSSWGGGGGGDFVSPGSSSGAAASAADELAAALKRLGDAMSDEVKRLRGLMVDDSAQSKDVLLARFATATAQARAGDQKAMELLPELSRAIENATKASAVSSVEVARMRGWLAGSLSATMETLGMEVPAFAVGTNYVPRDMLAMIHEGEAIVPKAFNPAAFAGPSTGASAEGNEDLRALRGQVEAFANVSLESSANAQRLLLRAVRVFERWDRSGMPQPRTENWSPA